MADQDEKPPERPTVKFELHQAPERPKRTGPLAAAENFLDSRIGTAFLTFLFTAVLGAFVTAIFTEGQKSRDRELAGVAEHRKEIREFQNYVSQQLVGREIRAGLVGSAIAHEFPDEELDRRWRSYEDAYIKYNELSFTFRPPLEDLRPRGVRGRNPFTHYLDNSISPSFTRVDACLTRAYALHRKSSALLDGVGLPRKDPLVPGVLICGRSEDGTEWTTRSELASLHRCLQTYQNELSIIARLKDRHDEARAQRFWRRWMSKALDSRRERTQVP